MPVNVFYDNSRSHDVWQKDNVAFIMCIRNRTLNYDSALRENWTISRCFLSLRTASKLCPICCVCSMAQRFCNLTRSESNPGGGEDDTRTWQRAEHSVEWCCCESPNTEVCPFTRSRDPDRGELTIAKLQVTRGEGARGGNFPRDWMETKHDMTTCSTWDGQGCSYNKWHCRHKKDGKVQ